MSNGDRNFVDLPPLLAHSLGLKRSECLQSAEFKKCNGNIELSSKHDICYLSLLMISPFDQAEWQCV
jgi:hypothetical protein